MGPRTRFTNVHDKLFKTFELLLAFVIAFTNQFRLKFPLISDILAYPILISTELYGCPL